MDVSRPLRGLCDAVGVTRPSTRFEYFRAYYSPNVKGVVASGLKATESPEKKRDPLLFKKKILVRRSLSKVKTT